MATSSIAVPVAEYLRTVYRPDRDYIEGDVQERNMGEKPHARLQRILLLLLEGFAAECDAEVFPEQRLHISPTRYRVPDLMLVSANDTDPRIVRTAPLLCVEILSSEDRMRKIEERLQDYAALGVPLHVGGRPLAPRRLHRRPGGRPAPAKGVDRRGGHVDPGQRRSTFRRA